MTYEARSLRLPGIGDKRLCVACATRFYDLARSPPVCPKCGVEQPPEPPRAPPVRRLPTRNRMVKAFTPAADADEAAAPELEADEDEAEEGEDSEPDEDAGGDEDEREHDSAHPEL
jgi:uncharacterized protein (TIGR02300 family)